MTVRRHDAGSIAEALRLLTSSNLDAVSFRDAMSRFAAAVHIVTTDGPAGRRGVTVTSVAPVSDDPATLLVCLNTSSVTNDRFAANGCFAVNLLGSQSEQLAQAFAGAGKLEAEERFALGDWETELTGSPLLVGSLASFDCRLIDCRIVATHQVMIGEVVGLRLGDPGEALLYLGRKFHRI